MSVKDPVVVTTVGNTNGIGGAFRPHRALTKHHGRYVPLAGPEALARPQLVLTGHLLHCGLFQGGVFSLRLTFTEAYPEKPPRVRFTSEVRERSLVTPLHSLQKSALTQLNAPGGVPAPHAIAATNVTGPPGVPPKCVCRWNVVHERVAGLVVAHPQHL